MPKRKITKKEIGMQEEIDPEVNAKLAPKSSKKLLLIVIGIIVIAILVYFKTNLINVATVNGNPITRWELEKELNSKFGEQTLETLINEKIILTEADKEGVTVNQSEIDKRMQEIEKRLEGQISLDDALKAQGLNRDSFQKQIEIQLIIDKMFEKEATVSESEIDEYIVQNQDVFPESTDPGQLRKDIFETLKQQKIGELFDAWFTKIKEKVSVVKL